MDCPGCGSPNEIGRKFCEVCGTRLARICPRCATQNGPTARFCGECGGSLAEPTTADTPDGLGRGPSNDGGRPGGPVQGSPRSAESAVAPIAERRLVSVLFADLVGFTGLAEDRDPEAVRELLTRYFDLSREVIARYGGTIEKFIGDAVMAVWGTPVAHEDDAERAVRAALDLVDVVRRLSGPGPDEQVNARAAVVTGEAAVTIGAINQGMIAGDLVNTASRLQGAAPVGSVLVGEATYHATTEAIAYEPAGDLTLKGKSAPVAAWRALRIVAKIGGVGRSEGLEPPFVGRDEQLRLLKELLHATARERRVRFISVIGQAGTGKSRLTWELLKYIDGLVDDVFWHQGRSPAYGEGITFWALGEMVRKRAGLAESDDQQTTRTKIAAALDEYVPDDGERRWIEPKLLGLLGLEEVRTLEREELFAAWRTFFERVSEHGTTVLVFEDIHWADQGLLDFIDHLAEWSVGHPILIVTLARPEFLERHGDWGAGRRDFISLALDPLADGAMVDLLSGIVPGLPDGARQAILQRAEGIPLYAVETVRKLLLDGRLEGTGGVYRPVGDLTRLEIPDTLHALIAARLDALAPAERSLLQDASILGQTFTVAALASIVSVDLVDLEPRLRDLVRREVLSQNRDPRSPERGQFGFVQALIREVAYGTLSRSDRRARHLAAARYFESLGDDELAGVLATHYLDAYRASEAGPEAEALAAQARIALRAAGERAAVLHSPDQALVFLEQALVVSPDPIDRATILEQSGSAAHALNRTDAAERYFSEAVALYRDSGARSAVARATASLGLLYIFASRSEQSIALLEAVQDELADLHGDHNVVHLQATLARAYVFSEQNERAIELADKALIAAERLDQTSIIADAVMTKGVGLAYAGRRRESIILMTGVLELAEELGLVAEGLRARLNISQFQMANDPRQGLLVAKAGLERALRFGFRDWADLLFGNAAVAAVATGDWDWVVTTAAKVVVSDTMSVNQAEGLAQVDLISAYRGQAAGRVAFSEFAAMAGVAADPQVGAQLEVWRATIALATGDLDGADRGGAVNLAEPYYATVGAAMAGHGAIWRRDVRRLREIVERIDSIGLRGRAFDAERATFEAAITTLDGSERAVEAFLAAAADWRELDLPLGHGLCLLAFAHLLGPVDERAVAAADEARGLFEGLGAAALVDRLDLATRAFGERTAAVPGLGAPTIPVGEGVERDPAALEAR